MQDYPLKRILVNGYVVIAGGKNLCAAWSGLQRPLTLFVICACSRYVKTALPQHLEAQSRTAINFQKMRVSSSPGGNTRLEGCRTAIPHPALTFTIKLQRMHASPHKVNDRPKISETEAHLIFSSIGRL